MRNAVADFRPAVITSYDVVRFVLGLMLLTAAGLKGYQLATEPVAETGLFTSRWFLIGVVEFELFFGLWLLAGLYPRWTWRAALLCFSGFACISLYKALSGEATCGCFGKVPVNPWYTFLLDTAAVTALSWFRPQRGPSEAVQGNARVLIRPAGVTLLCMALGVPAGLAMASYHAASLDDAGEIFGASQFVVLKPETWIGKRFPLLEYIDIGDRLAKGKWMVVLYHGDCPKCQRVLPTYEHRARRRAYLPDALRVALIEVQRSGTQLAKRCPSCCHGRLAEDRTWFVETPTVVVLLNGAVVSLGGDVESTRFVALGRTDRHMRGTPSAPGKIPPKDVALMFVPASILESSAPPLG